VVGGRGEPVRLAAHTLRHADEEVGQRIVAFAEDGEMLAVTEAAAGGEHREVGGRALVGIAEVAAIKHHAAFEQVGIAFGGRAQSRQQFSQQTQMPAVEGRQLRQGCFRCARGGRGCGSRR